MSTAVKLARCALLALPVAVSLPAALHAEPGHGGDTGSEDFVRVEESITIEASEFRFEPSRLEIPVGTEVAITLENEGAIAHNLFVVEPEKQTTTIQSSNETSFTVEFAETGTYAFHCNVPGHKEAGMRGTIRVVEE